MTRGAKSAPASLTETSVSPVAASHITVLLNEAVEALNVRADGIYVDGTFGRGGHSRLILSKLGSQGRLIGLDRDLAAVAHGQAIADARFSMVHAHFSSMATVLAELGVQAVDGILLDLGISSPQIDEGERGFSFRFDGPLDMRMDQSRGQTAAEWLAAISEKQLVEVIRDYGEERFAKQVARAIVKEREDGRPITTTGQLAKVVAGAIPKNEPGQNPATRTFQALRIFVNQELEELSLVMPDCLRLLRPQGRLAVISFHSLEDRIVKRFIQSEEDRDNLPAGLPVRAKDLPQPRLVSVGKTIKPSKAEVAANVRSRSAVLRVAERTIVQ
ncbi:16S rRNA (cytosine(1402)-N(4))-methyltransferase RsmH [Methylophilus sp. TWE2]|uniref:16S rRNA (cytosine(1402)-N(4))-methyltransferase RsmH n=1 Tax=Methylophilus sp. TWE2 TaxID=1662285 RepID=UPI000670F971|nr:16S rRNA (cytosine(1402)-N(4))-methyltransferase RsmH [Methylophilus sp. TWE2]AKR44148.1 16S rRNA methyltransferase [Methylophilus sp. TWE2]